MIPGIVYFEYNRVGGWRVVSTNWNALPEVPFIAAKEQNTIALQGYFNRKLRTGHWCKRPHKEIAHVQHHQARAALLPQIRLPMEIRHSDGAGGRRISQDSKTKETSMGTNPGKSIHQTHADELQAAIEQVHEYRLALNSVITERDALKKVLDAVINLRKQKGRHNTEQAYQRLMDAVAEYENLVKAQA